MRKTLMICLLLTALCCGAEVLFLRLRRKGHHWRSFCLKGLAALSFVGVGLTLALHTGRGSLVVWGLCCGLLGDQLLALRKIIPSRHDLMFIAGALAFSAGHVFYMAALLGEKPGMLLPAVPVFLVLMAGSAAFARVSGFRGHQMHGPGLAYIAIEAMMCALALVGLWKAPGLSAALFAGGGVSFLVSDNLLCAYSFGSMKTDRTDRYLHITYIGAQLMIAWSLGA